MSLTLLLAVHLGTNYRAVNSVALRTLNRQRANIVFSRLSDTGVALTPAQAARLERVFERDGLLRWRESEILGYARIGVEVAELARSIRATTATAAGDGNSVLGISDVANVFRNEKHVLWYDSRGQMVTICLKNDITPEDQLKAWVHALFVAREARHREAKDGKRQTPKDLLSVLETTLHDLGMSFTDNVKRLKGVGWDLGTAVLETKPGYRVGICSVEIPDAGKDRGETRFHEDGAKKDI